MLERLFPKTIDNDYRGGWLAVILFLPVLLWKLAIGIHISGMNPWINNRFVMKAADGMPLDRAGAEESSWIVYLASSWGVLLVIVCALALLCLIRYRAMLPLVILMLAAEQIGRQLIAAFQPIMRPASDGVSFGVMLNWGFTIALGVAFLLSLIPRKR